MGLIGAKVKEINKTMGTGDGVARGFYIVCCACGKAQGVEIVVLDIVGDPDPAEVTIKCHECEQKVRIY